MEIDPPSSFDHFIPPSIPSQSSSWDLSMPQGSSGDLLDSQAFQPPAIQTDSMDTLPQDLSNIRFPMPPVTSDSPQFSTPPSLPEDNKLPIPSQFLSSLASPTPSQLLSPPQFPSPPIIPSSDGSLVQSSPDLLGSGLLETPPLDHPIPMGQLSLGTSHTYGSPIPQPT
ncbi:hypothetical protein PAXRUDRAFT_17431 [Paxillus rubicundulus Ve08.2h10]|uniref:Uncharacterized protein n=1 Tax=Paxillus rubicundulus Ve08.2h10 TaxID=930991 RepID=A0A0D0C321_9AGAM|nr:hypothetical protein PAXRUDRAFT_17431 [Paxillus rubicundulus Ve08.2h10]